MNYWFVISFAPYKILKNKGKSMNLISEILKYKNLSIIGNYKNVGKTTTLNYIIEKCRHQDITLGLTSIGVDGEGIDVVTKTTKPRIYVSKNTLVATASSLALGSDITKEIIEVTNISTPLGNIVIFKALSDGYIELAGPSINSQIKYICEKLKSFGADLSIVDGALSRKTLGSPAITEATVFCSGAIIDKNVNKAIDKIAYEANILNLDNINDNNLDKVYKEIKNNKVTLINKDYSYKKLNISTTLDSSKEIIDNIEDNTKYLAINGIVTNNLINDFMKSGNKYKSMTILVEDSTKIFLDKETYDKFIKLKGNLKSINKVNLIGISINPTSIEGYSFDEDYFINNIQNKTNTKVFNVMSI